VSKTDEQLRETVIEGFEAIVAACPGLVWDATDLTTVLERVTRHAWKSPGYAYRAGKNHLLDRIRRNRSLARLASIQARLAPALEARLAEQGRRTRLFELAEQQAFDALLGQEALGQGRSGWMESLTAIQKQQVLLAWDVTFGRRNRLELQAQSQIDIGCHYQWLCRGRKLLALLSVELAEVMAVSWNRPLPGIKLPTGYRLVGDQVQPILNWPRHGRRAETPCPL